MDLTTFLLARIAEDEAAARASGAGTWHVECPYRDNYTGDADEEELAEHFAGAFHADECVIGGTDGLRIYDEGGHTAADAQHIARHDPARVLAQCAAYRLLIADLTAEKHEVVEDCWYTCPAATEERDGGECCRDADGECDCGRDYRVNRRLRALASIWAGHPAYEGGWAL